MLSFAEAFEEVDELQDICYDMAAKRGTEEGLVRKHLGTWILRKKGPWAVVVVATVERWKPSMDWGNPLWTLAKWRKMRGRWHNWTEFRVTDDDMFYWLFGMPGTSIMHVIRSEVDEALERERDTGILVPVCREC